ncbi:MAG: DUF1420 family protein [Deltaproteobacteria bacterium]
MSLAPPFLTLGGLLLPPPLSATVALLLLLGLFELGLELSRRLRGKGWEPLDGAAGLVVLVAVAAALLHALAWAGLARLTLLRSLAFALGLTGLVGAVRLPGRMVGVREGAQRWWDEAGSWERLLLAALFVIAVALAVASLAPATDADSLDYHLGVPLDWLRHGGAQPRPDWFVARLVGVGDGLNLLGLAAGTDCLSALLQATGLGVAALAACSLYKESRDRILAAGLVVACPVALSLVPAQKPQLFPAAATLLALVLLSRRRSSLDRPTLALALGCAAFAMGCKYTFLLSGAVVVVTALWLASKQRRWTLLTAVAAVALLALPVYWRNYVFYGDPLSPFLEGLRRRPDPALLLFASYLRSFGAPRTLATLAALPWSFAFARPPTGALGLGLVAAVAAPWRDRRWWPLLVPAAVLFALLAATSQLTPRFFLEPYLWMACAIPASRWRPVRALLPPLLTAQAALVGAGALYILVQLAPGLVGAQARERLLDRVAPGGAEAHWLNRILAPADVVITPIRSRALLPRPFAVADSLQGLGSAEEEAERFWSLVRSAHATVLVMPWPLGPETPEPFRDAALASVPIGPPMPFESVARSPLVPRLPFQLRAFRLPSSRPHP